MCRQNNARHAGETHNNKRPPFGAVRFTCVGMKIFWVTFANVSFPIGKVTFLRPTGHRHACPLHQ